MNFVRQHEQLFFLAMACAIVAAAVVIATAQNIDNGKVNTSNASPLPTESPLYPAY